MSANNQCEERHIVLALFWIVRCFVCWLRAWIRGCCGLLFVVSPNLQQVEECIDVLYGFAFLLSVTCVQGK